MDLDLSNGPTDLTMRVILSMGISTAKVLWAYQTDPNIWEISNAIKYTGKGVLNGAMVKNI